MGRGTGLCSTELNRVQWESIPYYIRSFVQLPPSLPPSSSLHQGFSFSVTLSLEKESYTKLWLDDLGSHHTRTEVVDTKWFSLWISENSPHGFSANILMECAPLGFLVMTLGLDIVVLFTVQCLVHPAVITLLQVLTNFFLNFSHI